MNNGDRYSQAIKLALEASNASCGLLALVREQGEECNGLKRENEVIGLSHQVLQTCLASLSGILEACTDAGLDYSNVNDLKATLAMPKLMPGPPEAIRQQVTEWIETSSEVAKKLADKIRNNYGKHDGKVLPEC